MRRRLTECLNSELDSSEPAMQTWKHMYDIMAAILYYIKIPFWKPEYKHNYTEYNSIA